MDTGHHDPCASGDERVHRAIVVFDVVESVRLMAEDEAGAIARWRTLLGLVRAHVLPRHRGRMVKSLGDGMLLEFPQVPLAVAAALDIQRQAAQLGQGQPEERRVLLRAGIHECDVVVDEQDVFGAGVNLAARLATLAAPGETVASAEAQQRLIVGVDADVEDLGECFVKHLPAPVRAFKLREVGQPPAARQVRAGLSLRPTLAVAPLESDGGAPVEPELVAALSDDLVAALGRVPQWTVISRLTTSAMQGRRFAPEQFAEIVGAQFVIAGRLGRVRQRLRLDLVVYEPPLDEPIWSGTREGLVDELFAFGDELVGGAVAEISAALLARQMQVAHAAALPNLPGYALLLRAISLLHSLGREGVGRANEALQRLVELHPRAPEAKAWLAKWHFLRLAQATTPNRQEDIARARGLLAAALDLDPAHALSLAIDGHLRSFLDGDAQAALQRLQHAVQVAPNEPLGWLFLSHALTSADRGEEAVAAVAQAQGIAPIDPLAYYYELFAANALSAAGRHEQALALTRRSIARNTLHLSSWVQLIVDLVLTRRMDEAQAAARHYLAMRPQASVRRFLERHSARHTPLARRDAEALLAAGLPP